MVNSAGVRVAVIGSGFAGLGMEVVTDGIREVREHSIVTTDGTEREVDTIIVGTGFQVSEMPAACAASRTSSCSSARTVRGTLPRHDETEAGRTPHRRGAATAIGRAPAGSDRHWSLMDQETHL